MMPTNTNIALKQRLRGPRRLSNSGKAALGANGGAKVLYNAPTGRNLAGPAARLARRLNGLPAARQTRRQKKAAKRARRAVRS